MGKIVVPGEEIPLEVANDNFRAGGKNYSAVVGMLKEEEKRLVPLSGVYEPRRGDIVIGVMASQRGRGYFVDLDTPFDAFLLTRRMYHAGDIIIAKVTEVNEIKSITLGFERKLEAGDLAKTSTVKVARMIGKNGSMLALIQEKTGCEMNVGKNGLIWMRGPNLEKVKEVLNLIEKEAHLSGLTDKVKELLEKGLPKAPKAPLQNATSILEAADFAAD